MYLDKFTAEINHLCLQNKAIKNQYIRQNIDRSKSLVYARQS